MLKQLSKIYHHSLLMMKIHWQAYLSLSITIVISLGLLLGILFYSDTTYFNQNKDFLSSPPNLIQPTISDSKSSKALQTIAKKYDKAFTFSWKTGHIQMHSYLLKNVSLNALAYFVDQNFFDYPIYHQGSFKNLSIIRGRSFTQEEVSTKKKVLLIEEKFSDLLFGKEGAIGKEIRLPTNFLTESLPDTITPYTIIGVVKSYDYFPSNILDENYSALGNIFLPLNALSDFKGLNVLEDTLLVADNEEVAQSIGNALTMEGLTYISSLKLQRHALNNYLEMRKNQTPLIITVLIILSLNLFALHANVLKKRNQEIAIKRALGASKGSILAEFFIEGMIIFVINFLLVNFIIATIGIVWYYFNHIKFLDNIKTILITSYSINLYLVISLTLTLLNSLILAYQATRVVIIDAIKSE